MASYPATYISNFLSWIMEYLQSSSAFYIAATVSSFLVYLTTIGVYRLYFSPYAPFPGPLLARVTSGYAFYYNVIGGGQYMFKIQELHEEYSRLLPFFPYVCLVSLFTQRSREHSCTSLHFNPMLEKVLTLISTPYT